MLSDNLKKKIPFLLVFTFFLAPRLLGLGADLSNSDSARWHRRSENFLQALKSGDFKTTYQRYHPGVVLMWVNATVKQVTFSYQLSYTDTPKTTNNADWFPIIHGISKGANVFVLFGLFSLQLFLLSHLKGSKVALWYGFFLSLEPYFIGINRWFHLSSFEVYFAFSSILALLAWSKNLVSNARLARRFLLVSAILFALALLSKITSLIMAPVLLYVFVAELTKSRNTKDVGTAVLIFSLICLISIFILFPALWVAPDFVFSKIYNAVFGAVSTDVRSTLIPGYLKPFYFAVIGLLRLSPVTLLVFLAGLWKLRKSSDPVVRTSMLVIAVYYLVFIPASQKIDRYVIMFFPAIFVIVASFAQELSQKLQHLILLSVATCFVWVTLTFFPLYSAYYSPIFGGSRTALAMGVYENSGEYFAQAANYLNEKGRDIKVFVPDNVDAFQYYFKGNLVGSYEDAPDYVVRSLDIDRNIVTDTTCPILEKSFGNKYLDTIFIFSCIGNL